MFIPYDKEQGGHGILWSWLFMATTACIWLAVAVLGISADSLVLHIHDWKLPQYVTALFVHQSIIHLAVAAAGMYLGALLVENRVGFSSLVLAWFLGGILGEISQVVIFRSLDTAQTVSGMEGGVTAVIISGLALWPEEPLRWRLPGRPERRVNPMPVAMGWGILMAGYYLFITFVQHLTPGWGVLLGGVATGLAVSLLYLPLGVRELCRVGKAAKLFEGATLGGSASLPGLPEGADPAALEQTFRNALNERNEYLASQTGALMMQHYLDEGNHDFAYRLLERLDGSFPQARLPGRVLVPLAQFCIDQALIKKAKELTARITRSSMDAPGLDELLFRMIEVLIDTSSVDIEAAEYFLSRFELLGPESQHFEYLRGRLFKTKYAVEMNEKDTRIVGLVQEERYIEALSTIRMLKGEVHVPPDHLLSLARGLLSIPSLKDAAEVLAMIAHQYPEAPETPEAVYQLIQLLFERLDNEKHAMAWFDFLKDNFPTSPATEQVRSYLERARREKRRHMFRDKP